MNRRVNIALYGANGHQIHEALADHPFAQLVGTADFPREKLPTALLENPEVKNYASLDEILSDPRVDLISLCSPRRCDQAAHAIRALRAGKHVYAEKPSALEEEELDAILRASQESGRLFREMAGTAFEQPYFMMRQIVREGRIGKVIQVIAEKSYPYQNWRPQDENIDGGLILQCAVHGMRFVEHVAGLRVLSVQAMETTAGNRGADGELRMAACLMMQLENGALASIAANYLNPRGTGIWGYETLRMLGERGMVESTQGGGHSRLVVDDEDFGSLDFTKPGLNYLDAYLKTILGKGEMPQSLEEELSPTRWVIRAKRFL